MKVHACGSSHDKLASNKPPRKKQKGDPLSLRQGGGFTPNWCRFRDRIRNT